VFDQQEMATNDVYRFIDQHPLVLVVLFPGFFVAWWLQVGAIGFSDGWFSLSKLYPRRVPFKSATWTMQIDRVRRLTNDNNMLTIGARAESLYSGCCALLFRNIRPPRLIPWGQIKVRKSKRWILDYVTFTMSRETAIPLVFERGRPRRCRLAMDGLSRKHDSIPRAKYPLTVAHYFPVRLGTMILANKDGKTNARVAQGIA